MSVFSSKLQEFVAMSNVKIAMLSKLSGVERSFIQKMLIGERIPNDADVIHQLASSLMLTSGQTKSLMECYSISKMGEANYFRRLLVKNLLTNVTELQLPYRLPVPQNQNKQEITIESCTISGSDNVIHAAKLMLEKEASQEMPSLKMILQPECHNLMEVIHLVCNDCPTFTVEHIFCFDSELQYQKENKYNIECIYNIMPMIFSDYSYSPYYYYNSTQLHIDETSPFPYLLLSGETVMAISYGLDYAILLSGKNFFALYNRFFAELKEKTFPVISNLSSPLEYVSHCLVSEADNDISTAIYSIQDEPCLGFFCTMDMVQESMRTDIAGNGEIRKAFGQRIQWISRLSGVVQTVFYFTEDGIDRFLATGRISEVPSVYYKPLSPRNRYLILHNMMLFVQRGNFTPYIINPEKFVFPKNLCISSLGDNSLNFLVIRPNNQMMSFDFHEKSVAYSVRDFLDFLSNSSMVYPQEKSLEILGSKLKKAEHMAQASL